MQISDLIIKKNNKKRLSQDEIKFFIDGAVNGTIEQKDIVRLLKAIYDFGMTNNETSDLALAMCDSGERLHFDETIIDKHSTGGVSDSTSLIIVPILASLNYKIVKMSGKSLGHTGGTVDKLHVFDDIQTEKNHQQILKLLEQTNACMIEQSKTLVPADKILYALRDETGLVDSIPLIASSITSKKLASGADVVLFDVKCGDGAFFSDTKKAKKLARLMTHIMKNNKVKSNALITDMTQPLGKNIGCNLEMVEVIEVLNGKEGRLKSLCIELATRLICMTDKTKYKDAKQKVLLALSSKLALKKFEEIMSAQNANIEKIVNPELIEVAKINHKVCASKCGYIEKICTKKLGQIVNIMSDKNDRSVGIKMNVEIGDFVDKNCELFTVFYNDKVQLQKVKNELKNLVILSDKFVKKNKLILRVVR